MFILNPFVWPHLGHHAGVWEELRGISSRNLGRFAPFITGGLGGTPLIWEGRVITRRVLDPDFVGVLWGGHL